MPNITKQYLIQEIAKSTGFVRNDIKIVVEQFLDLVGEKLIEGNTIEIRGFGRFKLKERKQRSARNPRTGETVVINAGTKPVFEASKELIKSLNDILVAAEAASAPVKSNGK